MKIEIEVIIALGVFVVSSLLAVKGIPISPSLAYYFTGRGGMGKVLLFFTFFATYFSAFTVVGLPALYFAHGIGAFFFLGVGVLLTPLTIYFIGYRLVRSASKQPAFFSPVALLTDAYHSAPLTATISISTVALLVPYLILQIAGVGKFFLGLTGGELSYTSGTTICCLIVGIYLYKGGAIADARTDLVQGIFMVLGTFGLGGFVLYEVFTDNFDYWGALQAKQLLSIPGPNGYFTLPVLISYAFLFGLISIATPQVSSKMMGAESPEKLRPSVLYFPLIGIIIIFCSGVFGLYAAARLDVVAPDLVIGDVLRSVGQTGEGSTWAFQILAVLFIVGVVSAAVSTIDSLLLSIAAIFGEVAGSRHRIEVLKAKLLMTFILLLSFLLSFNPPRFIADLAKIQVGGLMAFLPCIVAPLFGARNSWAGWTSISFGVATLVAERLFGISFLGFDVGFISLLTATAGIFVGSGLSRLLQRPIPPIVGE